MPHFTRLRCKTVDRGTLGMLYGGYAHEKHPEVSESNFRRGISSDAEMSVSSVVVIEFGPQWTACRCKMIYGRLAVFSSNMDWSGSPALWQLPVVSGPRWLCTCIASVSQAMTSWPVMKSIIILYLFYHANWQPDRYRYIDKLENVAIANALQLEAARRRAVPLCYKFVAHAKFEVDQPIRCRIRSFLLLIRYVTVWPWTLTP